MTTFAPEDDAAILRGGWDDRTLADMLFMSVTTLRDRRRELTRPPRVPCKPRPYKPRQQYKTWSASQDQRLRDLLGEGLTFRQVATRMDRTKESISCRFERLRGIRQ